MIKEESSLSDTVYDAGTLGKMREGKPDLKAHQFVRTTKEISYGDKTMPIHTLGSASSATFSIGTYWRITLHHDEKVLVAHFNEEQFDSCLEFIYLKSKAVAEAEQQDWSSDEKKEEWIKQRKKELGETEHYYQAVYMTIEDSIDAVRKYAFSYKKNLKKEENND